MRANIRRENKVKTQVHLFARAKSRGIFWDHSTVRGLSKSFCTSELKISANRWTERREKIPTRVEKEMIVKKVETVFRGNTENFHRWRQYESHESHQGQKHPTSVTPEAANDLIF